jgi:hypothetical protein
LGSLQLAANSTPQSTKETQRVIFIDEGQDVVRSRVQAVKAIAQSEVSAIVHHVAVYIFQSCRLSHGTTRAVNLVVLHGGGRSRRYLLYSYSYVLYLKHLWSSCVSASAGVCRASPKNDSLPGGLSDSARYVLS